jgi:hypothetical protein
MASDSSSTAVAAPTTTPLAQRVTTIPARAGRWVKGSCLEFKTTFVSWVKDWGLEDYADFLSLIAAICTFTRLSAAPLCNRGMNCCVLRYKQIAYVVIDGVDLANINETTVNDFYVLLAALYFVDSLMYWYDFEKETPAGAKYRRWAQVSEWTNVFGSALYFGNPPPRRRCTTFTHLCVCLCGVHNSSSIVAVN